MFFIYTTWFFNLIIPVLGIYLFKKKNRRILMLLLLIVIPIIYVSIYKDVGYGLLFVLSPILNSLWYLAIRFFYIKDLKREPIIPSRTGNFNFDENRYPDSADYIFMIIVMIAPIFAMVYIMTKAFPN